MWEGKAHGTLLQGKELQTLMTAERSEGVSFPWDELYRIIDYPMQNGKN